MGVYGDELDIVNAARVSFNRKSDTLQEKDILLLSYLCRERHTTPLERPVLTFEIYCPIFVSKQWMRHRTWTYNEVSRRYTSKDIAFYHPKKWRKQAEDNKQCSNGVITDDTLIKARYNFIMESSIYTYNELLDKGVAREQARMVLPQSLMTKFQAQVNLHNLLHFLTLRIAKNSQHEIREYAVGIVKLIKDYFPNVLASYGIEVEGYIKHV